MNIPSAEKIAYLQSGIFPRLAELKHALQARGREVIDLSIGSPDLEPSERIRKAIAASAEDGGSYRYSLSDIPELRCAMSAWYDRRYGVDVDPVSELFSTCGAQDGLTHIFLAYLNPGEKVLIQNPCFPAVMAGIRQAGAVPVSMSLKEENGFLIDFSGIREEDARRARMIVVSYPNNPTSALAPDSFYEDLIDYAKRYDLLILHDNAYSDIVFDGLPGKSIFEFSGAWDCAIEFNSLSKTFSVPGIRMSFCVGRSEIIDPFRILNSNLSLGTFLPIQYGAIAALETDYEEVRKMCGIYRKRRDALMEELADSPLRAVPCHGSLFTWVALPKPIHDDMWFVVKLAEETGVLAAPGSAFGSEGAGYIRFSLMQKKEVLRMAVKRINQCSVIQKSV